jgi:hypothetical protein
LSTLLIIFIFSLVFSSIWPCENTIAVHFIIFPVSDKFSSISPGIDT